LIALGLLAALAFLPRLVARVRRGPTLSVAELHERLQGTGSLQLLDVRPSDDYRGALGHIHGSRNIPLETLEARLGELSADRDTPIALICTTDRRSAKAAKILSAQGFTDVRVVIGGMRQWNLDGLPVQRAGQS
jgi:rhodanese-related sulfurtransferase